jgi:hypothetical protein
MATVLRPRREGYEEAEERLLGWARDRYANGEITLSQLESKVAQILGASSGLVDRDRHTFKYR